MNTDLNVLIRHFFNCSDISELPEADIRQFLSEHPYSVVGQILLAKKLQQSGSETFIEQANATALYVHDPLWLQFLLSDQQQQSPVEPINGYETAVAAETDDEQSSPSTENFFIENIGNDVSESPDTQSVESITETEVSEPEIAEENTSEPVQETGLQNIEENNPGSNTTLTELTEPTDAETEIPVEPYHTIDYFASQGIKLQQAELGGDKLGQQLKSFTEWLRSMKRLPQATIEAQVDPVAEQSINRIAEHSLEEKEILTEAMAEVWEKQGNKRKAIEVYNKLSLQNPAKSAYFAAKIEQLKSL